MTDAEALTGIAAAGSIKEMGMRKILFEKWDKEAAAGELQKNPDILTKIYLGVRSFDPIITFLLAGSSISENVNKDDLKMT